jgi:hypothetical protein
MTSSAPSAERRGTMVVLMTVDPSRGDQVDRHFREDVRPWAQSQAGFVSAQWLRVADGDRGMGLVTFETEAQAQAASQGPRSQPTVEGRAWNTDAVDVYAVVAHA